MSTNTSWAGAATCKTRWKLNDPFGVRWDAGKDERLPHQDHVEMSGRKISVILSYQVATDRSIKVSRKMIWPTLRLTPQGVRSYLVRIFSDLDTPVRFKIDGEEIDIVSVDRVVFDGVFRVLYRALGAIEVERCIIPSPDRPAVHERWTFKNTGKSRCRIEAWYPEQKETDKGMYGDYLITAGMVNSKIELKSGQAKAIAIQFSAGLGRKSKRPPISPPSVATDITLRTKWIKTISENLKLETPDAMLNTAFGFCKIRTSECVFDTKLGLMHSPAGGSYYGGMWANDQGEYVAPLAPYLADKKINEAITNCFELFSRFINPEFSPLPSSLEMEGDIIVRLFKDRGDAAMFASGLGRFLLASGNPNAVRKLWPFLAWCLDYCESRKTADGVIASEMDELEGRFPAGSTNLHTSCLYFDALRSASFLSTDSDIAPGKAKIFQEQASALRRSIEAVFGAKIRGFKTYRYYDGNTTLRAWIGSPLTVGILERAEGTLSALFSDFLWRGNAIATEEGKPDFWDRSALYALRGAFIAGATEEAVGRLKTYTEQRLLGEHVPYPVEAFPEGNGSHMAAESALYVRIITEGVFGLRPIGLRKFELFPRLPAAWPSMALRNIRSHRDKFDIEVARHKKMLEIRVFRAGKTIFSWAGKEDDQPIQICDLDAR